MLLKAGFNRDKVEVIHGYDPGPLLAYNQEMRKDDSNGWTKGKSMRHIARLDANAMDAYARTHPGWKERLEDTRNINGQRKALLEFCNDQPFAPEAYLNVEKRTI